MASTNAGPQSRYEEEAGTFLSTMGEVAPQLRLDYSVESLQRLDHFISEHFEPLGEKSIAESLPIGSGSYVGEVIIRHLGGHWNEEGRPEVNEVGALEVIYPIEKAHKRFQNGREDSLAWYYHSIAKQAYEAEQIQAQKQETQSGGGFFDFLSNLFKK